MAFLSAFANGARYANLDALASGIRSSDPLAEWHTLLNDVVMADVPVEVRDALIGEATSMALSMNPWVALQADDLANRPLTLQRHLAQGSLQIEAARYIVWHLVSLAHRLKEMLVELSYEAIEINRVQRKDVMDIPHMGEFVDFIWADREYVLGKREWP